MPAQRLETFEMMPMPNEKSTNEVAREGQRGVKMRSLPELRNRTETFDKDAATTVDSESKRWHRIDGRGFPALTLNKSPSVIALVEHEIKLGCKDTGNAFEVTCTEVFADAFVDEPKNLNRKMHTGAAATNTTRWKTHSPFVKVHVLLEEEAKEQDALGATSTAAKKVAFNRI
jgi:hypothetical protein